MKSASFLSSARTTSLLVLLITYVSVDQSSRLLTTGGMLREAHQALARGVVLGQVSESDLGGTIERTFTNHSCGLAANPVEATRVLVTRPAHRQWRGDAFWCGFGASDADEPRRTLQQISRQLHLATSDMARLVDLFDGIEHQIIDERVNIAPLGFELRGDLTPWVIGPVVIGLLALMRNGIRRVLADDEHAADEPWLLVDAGVGVERVVAVLWIAAIAVAPWVCGASIFAAFAWRVYADGSLTTAVTDVTLVSVASLVLVSGAWLGITVASDLITLREARRTPDEREPERVATAAPDY